jgi:DNA repair protein RadC
MSVSALRRVPVAEPRPALIAPGSPLDLAAASEHEMLAIVAGGSADALRRRFGDLAGALGGDRFELGRIGGSDLVWTCAVIQECALRLARASLARRPLISNHAALVAYLTVAMAWRGREQFRVLFLDKKNQVIVDEVMNEGTVDHAPVYPREVMRRALELDAAAVVLAHNHPSGDVTASSGDVDMTGQVVAAGRALRIAVHDHLIIGRHGVSSMKAQGLM